MFYLGGGYGLFSPGEWEKTIGSWIELPSQKTVNGKIIETKQ